MSRVPLKDGSLFVRIDGDRAGAPWLVLVNSIAADHSMWDPQVADVAARYRVLRYDARGHGASDAPAGPYTFDLLVDDLVAILDFHRIAKATFMGLSLGGMTLLGLGLREPARVTGLVCCCARADAPPAFVKSWDDRVALIKAGGMEAIVDSTLERWLTARTRTADPALAEKLRRMIRSTAPRGFEGCAAALKGLDYLGRLGKLACPAHFVAGAEDMGAPASVMKQMAAASPGAQLSVVADAAHIANLDNPAGFRAAVAPFLGLATPATA